MRIEALRIRPDFSETPYVVVRYCDMWFLAERGRIIKGFWDQWHLAFVKNLPSQWMKRSLRSSRRSSQNISSTVPVSFLSQHVLKASFKFLEEPVNAFPHCWVTSTGDATEKEPVTVLTTWFCFCENSLQRQREEAREKSLEKATQASWTGRMFEVAECFDLRVPVLHHLSPAGLTRGAKRTALRSISHKPSRHLGYKTKPRNVFSRPFEALDHPLKNSTLFSQEKPYF